MLASRPRYLPCLVLVLGSLAAGAADEVPPQFKVWGTRGPELPPVPAGWTEVRAEPRIREAPKAAEKDVASGFILWQQHPFEEVFHDTIPSEDERRDVRLQSFAAQGQYEPFSVAFYALEDLKGVVLKLGELRTKDGGSIAASQVEVRLVRPVRSKIAYGDPKDKRFRLAPFYLEKWERFDVGKGKTAQVWITVKVPDSARSGDYQAKAALQAEGKAAADIPVLLRVLPFRLPPVAVENVLSDPVETDATLREKQLIDQREHGIVNSESGMGARIVSRDQDFGEDDVAATRAQLRNAIALRKRVYGADAKCWPAPAEIGHQILYYWDTRKNWMEFWPRSDKMEADFFKAIRLVEETLKAEDGPAMRLFVMDEPGGHPDTLKETVAWVKAAKEKFPQIPGYVTIGGGLSMGIDEIGMLGPYVELLSTNRFTTELCRRLLDRKKPYGIYNGAGVSEAVREFARDRHFFGFYGWKTGAGQILQWVYRFGDPWQAPMRGNHGYVYVAPSGPLPSISFESLRVGTDDYRYMDLLWRLITAAKKSGRPQAVEAAKAGEQMALEIMNCIDFNYQSCGGADSPPPAAATLEKWRWKTAAAILELLKHVPLEQALGTRPERPGPLDMPFPKEETLVTYGPELIAEGGFENGPGPWAASGKVGKGGIDETQHHGGAKSFRIENPPAASGTDVIICVWGWSGPGPSMTCHAGKTYDFSGWVKYDGVPPQMRCNFAGAVTSRDEQEEGESENGWKRLYRRVTMSKDARPSYLGVWLQGPGTVWCDDLSMREVFLPPFYVEPAQTVLDDSDKAVAVRLKQVGGAGAVTVRVWLPANKQPLTVSIPPNSQTIIEFAGDVLPLGKHELKAELAGGATPYVRTLAFERIRGPLER